MPSPVPVTVVETPEFVARTRRLMDDADCAALVDHLAHNPRAGDLIPGTGGVRKLRWQLAGRGKRGGARVIYFFHSANVPLFALTAYAKNEREDLSQQDRHAFKRLTKILIESYRRTER